MKHITLTLLALLPVSGCNTTHVARLDNGAGIGEGSRVVVSGVQVGAVSDVRVVEGHVDVEFEIDSDHEITFRQDACALPFPEEGGGYLLVTPGTGAALQDDERPIPQCRIEARAVTDDTFRDLAQGMGELIEQLGRGLLQPPGGAPGRDPNAPNDPFPSSPFPSSPFPSSPQLPPRDRSDSCDQVSVRVGEVEHVADGYRAWIEFHNANPFSMHIGAVNDASFLDGNGEVLHPETLPGHGSDWFMPFDLPADASQRVGVVFATEPSIASVEVRQSSPSDDILSFCTISNR